MSGDGDIPQGGYNHGGNKLCPIHQEILQGHRSAYLHGVSYIVPMPCETFNILLPCQYGTAEDGVISQRKSYTDESQQTPEGSTRHTESESWHCHVCPEEENSTCGEDEKVVEEYIQQAHQYRHDAGTAHIACSLQHCCRRVFKQMEGDDEREDKKVDRGLMLYVPSAAQPGREVVGDEKGDKQEEQRVEASESVAMAHDCPCLGKVVGTDEVGRLD